MVHPSLVLLTGIVGLCAPLFSLEVDVKEVETVTNRMQSSLSVALVYCGQTFGWIKMPLGMKVGLDPGHVLLDGDPAPPRKK